MYLVDRLTRKAAGVKFPMVGFLMDVGQAAEKLPLNMQLHQDRLAACPNTPFLFRTIFGSIIRLVLSALSMMWNRFSIGR